MCANFCVVFVSLLLVGSPFIGACASNDAVRFEPICRPLDEGRFVRYDPAIRNRTTNLWQCNDGRAQRLNCSTPITDPFRRYFGLCRHNNPDEDGSPLQSALTNHNETSASDFQCPSGDVGAFAMRGNCTHYHFCRGEVHTVRRCADGMHFDEERGGCNFEHLARCTREVCPQTTADGVRNVGRVWVTVPSKSSCGE